MTNTFCPCSTRPTSHRARRAVSADTGTTAACSKVVFTGLRASLSSRATAYSANEPGPIPNTSSPGVNLVTAEPTATTVPATSRPGTGFFGRRIPKLRRSRYGRPVIRCHVPRSRPAACTRRSTSLSATSGRLIGARRKTSAEPYVSCTIACIVSSAVARPATSPPIAACCPSNPMTDSPPNRRGAPAVLSMGGYSTKYERASSRE